jgi:hypothetical protein
LGKGNSSLFKKKRAKSSSRGDDYKKSEIGWGHLKTFLSVTTEPEKF